MACTPNSGEAAPGSTQTAPSAHPVSGLTVVPLTVTSGDKVHKFHVELARTAQEQARGMMFRTAMGADEGMIFPMNPPRGASFWMRNTVIPLDLIFVGVDGRISNIAANAVPYDESPLRSVGLVIAVLELNGGRAAELGLKPGDKVSW
ncbi:MAG: DUF192 domain-containing protein [Novosphingobium sp.]|nr:DUF192 domain-containing protein [Novosphingobium sp.]MDP3907919.1 DUF192 domain-containing protein [Novosphingobium sp.]